MRRARTIGSTVVVAGALALGALLVVSAALGYQRYVITGGSMTGTLDRGSLVFDRSVPVSSLRVGDVITYQPPAGLAPPGLVTHRIVWMGRDRFGRRAFRTRGDANPTADPWRFTLQHATQARVAFHVPLVGYALAALGVRWLRMLLLGVPALAIGLARARQLWRDEPSAPGGARA